jgi:hypothetical protein
VAEVAERLGVSAKRLHRQAKLVKPGKLDEQAAQLPKSKKKYLSCVLNFDEPQRIADVQSPTLTFLG